MEEPVIPFDVWLIIASFCTPYVYNSLCLTNRTIQQRIRHLKNGFFKEYAVIHKWCSTKPDFITLVEFGKDSDRTDIYIEDECVSVNGMNGRNCVFKYYPIPDLYAVYTERGIVCVIQQGKAHYSQLGNDFQRLLILASDQVAHNVGPNVSEEDIRDLCAAKLTLCNDVVDTIMAVYQLL